MIWVVLALLVSGCAFGNVDGKGFWCAGCTSLKNEGFEMKGLGDLPDNLVNIGVQTVGDD